MIPIESRTYSIRTSFICVVNVCALILFAYNLYQVNARIVFFFFKLTDGANDEGSWTKLRWTKNNEVKMENCRMNIMIVDFQVEIFRQEKTYTTLQRHFHLISSFVYIFFFIQFYDSATFNNDLDVNNDNILNAHICLTLCHSLPHRARSSI